MTAVYALLAWALIIWIWRWLEPRWMDDTTAVNPYQEDQR